MNYRHIYHAGNFADVIKHVILIGLLEQLGKKEKGFCYLDTHAGIGLYDLDSAQAQKTGEYQGGIARLLAAEAPPPLVELYLAQVRALNPESLRCYPGSPLLAQSVLRLQDRAVLFELHPEDAALLRERFQGDRRLAVHAADGYRAVRRFLPPREGRGVLLVDPPFEQGDEFDRMLELLRAAQHAWRGGVVALWYPLKDRAAIRYFHNALVGGGIRKILLIEAMVHREEEPGRLNGSGMVIVNPPWQFEATLAETMPWLTRVLSGGEAPAPHVEWLVPE